MPRVALLLAILLAVIVGGWVWWRSHSESEPREVAAPIVIKKPVNYATRTFDPANPPSDMPPLPAGESAECDSSFESKADVGGKSFRKDPTHAVVTVTQVTVTLQLDITVWLPQGASQHVVDHEDGHRQISEYYYQNADQIAGRVAERYLGRQIEVSGPDLDAAVHTALQDTGGEITEDYNKELNTNPTQLLYDSITDHARNDTVATDAVAHALKNVAIEGPGR